MEETKEEPKIETKPETKKTTKGFRLNWFAWTVAGLAIIAIGTVLVTKFITPTAPENSPVAIPDTTSEISIKQYLSNLRGDIVSYYEQNQTYAGWTPKANTLDQVKKLGSELKTQALSSTTYIIYAKMPSSNTIFCMDHNNFTGEITNLMVWAKSCK